MARGAYRLGNSFEWCVMTFEALGEICRVLLILNTAKQKFEAVFGVELEDDLGSFRRTSFTRPNPVGTATRAAMN